MPSLMTVRGAILTSQLGLILPHEHLFLDFRPAGTPGYAQAGAVHVIERLRPYLEEIVQLGVTALVECTPVGVGRNVEMLRALSEAVDLPVVAATGAYRDDTVPAALREQPREALSEWMLRELTEGVADTGIRAGFIKLASTDSGLTPLEERLLRAAAQASLRTGAAIASHTVRGETALRQIAILEEEGADPRRFIWVHANNEPDPALHTKAGQRGAYLEYDAVGAPGQSDQHYIDLVRRAADGGRLRQVLLSQDAGWYDAGQPEAPIRGFGDLVRRFLPALREAGFSAEEALTLTAENPQRAFALAG